MTCRIPSDCVAAICRRKDLPHCVVMAIYDLQLSSLPSYLTSDLHLGPLIPSPALGPGVKRPAGLTGHPANLSSDDDV